MDEFKTYTEVDLVLSRQMILSTIDDLSRAIDQLSSCKAYLGAAADQLQPAAENTIKLRGKLQAYTRDYERAMHLLTGCASIRTWVMADSLGLDPGAVGIETD